MSDLLKNSILITGSTRSGTTYLGQLLALNTNFIYLWEPFQVGLKERNPNGVFDYWFEFLEKDSHKEEIVLEYLKHYAKLNKYDFLRLRTRNFEKLKFEIKNIQKKFFSNFNHNYSYIIKDPIAFYSAEWLYRHLKDLKVIVMIRNPISIIESYKRLNWDIGFIEIKRQDNLLKQFPKEYSSLIERYTNGKVDIVEKGILYWKIIYKKVLEYQEKYANRWLFIKLEDLAQNEDQNMKTIVDFCQIEHPIIKKVKNEKWLKNASVSSKKREKILKPKEIDKIINATYDIARNFEYFV